MIQQDLIRKNRYKSTNKLKSLTIRKKEEALIYLTNHNLEDLKIESAQDAERDSQSIE